MQLSLSSLNFSDDPTTHMTPHCTRIHQYKRRGELRLSTEYQCDAAKSGFTADKPLPTSDNFYSLLCCHGVQLHALGTACPPKWSSPTLQYSSLKDTVITRRTLYMQNTGQTMCALHKKNSTCIHITCLVLCLP